MLQSSKMYLKLEEIPFMHWGIITRYNFSPDKLHLVPRKRWDPLSSAPIVLPDASGRLVPIGKWKGHFSYISPIRGLRPGEDSDSKPRDVFKDIISGKDYAIFVALDDKPYDSVFSVEPIAVEISNTKAATIVNRFPAMVRVLDPELEGYLRSKLEDKHTRIARGINLVTFPVDAYYETFSEAPPDSLACVFKSLIQAIKSSVVEAQKHGHRLLPVYVFFNIGKMAGGSQPRLHAQTYIDLNEDGHGTFMENLLQAFDYSKSKCHLCSSRHDGRIVYENNTWIAWATSAPRRNFHVRIAPKRHLERITDLDESEIQGLVDTIITVSQAMDKVGIIRDRYLLIYSNPFGYNSFFHLFIDFIPFERIGGIEILDSVRVARVAPEEAARIIRGAIG
ncbi:HIT domain-containing protein [Infirmifilum lucidum]|uniref:HIT domain-containing protein n=1 Tax=Infirmifilum lucidum TaxID=2776706 RepID=A0A7L9FFA9_9CREN|nr:HIT domain-containing protein [Infirmifilum lucidum]QOJ78367.1 HIT domain-containing protein [Infirmifilum lucidum]